MVAESLVSNLLGVARPVEKTSSVATISAAADEAHPAASLDVDSDRQSQPSNINHSDSAAVSSEPEKSCLRSSHETQSRQMRSCTKLHMHGMAVGRAVDLTRFDGYSDLRLKLEEIFDIQGELSSAARKWQIVYTDDEGDIMLVGNDPWHEFCNMVRKIYIYTREEVKQLSPKAKLPSTKPGKKKPSPEADESLNCNEVQPSPGDEDCELPEKESQSRP